MKPRTNPRTARSVAPPGAGCGPGSTGIGIASGVKPPGRSVLHQTRAASSTTIATSTMNSAVTAASSRLLKISDLRLGELLGRRPRPDAICAREMVGLREEADPAVGVPRSSG